VKIIQFSWFSEQLNEKKKNFLLVGIFYLLDNIVEETPAGEAVKASLKSGCVVTGMRRGANEWITKMLDFADGQSVAADAHNAKKTHEFT